MRRKRQRAAGVSRRTGAYMVSGSYCQTRGAANEGRAAPAIDTITKTWNGAIVPLAHFVVGYEPEATTTIIIVVIAIINITIITRHHDNNSSNHPLHHGPRPGGMREAIKSQLRLLSRSVRLNASFTREESERA